MNAPPPSRAKAWLLLLAIAAGAIGFQFADKSRSWTERSTARELGKQLLEAHSELEAAALAEQLGELDQAGIEPLVVALTSDSPVVSTAAAEQIAKELGKWRGLPKKTSAPLVAELVHQLALEQEGIPPEHQWEIRQWAQVVLLWPLKKGSVDAGAVLEDCQTILGEPLPPDLPLDPRVAQAPAGDSQPELNVEAPSEMPAEDTLPPIVDPSAVLPPTAPPATAAEIPAEPEDTILAPILEPRGFLPPKARRVEDAPLPEEPQELPQGGEEGMPTKPVEPLPAESADPAGEFQDVADMDVMRELHSGGAEALSAEKELVRRGYKPQHLALARQLTNPDPEVRRKLVLALPRVKGIDPRTWLLRLSEDPDEEVRTAARSILKTSQDPELLDRLR